MQLPSSLEAKGEGNINLKEIYRLLKNFMTISSAFFINFHPLIPNKLSSLLITLFEKKISRTLPSESLLN